LFPLPAIRQRYRERLLNFRLNILPRYKLRTQSRVYRFLVERQRKRLERTRLVDIVRRQFQLGATPTQRLTPGAERKASLDEKITDQNKMASRHGYNYNYASNSTGYGSGSESGPPREAGARRKKLAAFAGSVYRAGAAAASEIKEQYNNTRIRNVEAIDASQYSIPGSFPNVKIIHKGEEQMVLFPTYAKKHVKGAGRYPPGHVVVQTQQQQQQQARDGQPGRQNQERFWKDEWDRNADENAVVDVDIRGWIYMPSTGPMTRRNRMVIGLARRLSGIPPPTTSQGGSSGDGGVSSAFEEHERMKEESRIAEEAREIERQGRKEEEVATRGGYSEGPDRSNSVRGGSDRPQTAGRARTSSSPPPSPPLPARTNTGIPADLTEAELAVANANLMARIGPFMTTPLVQHPITLFFYNDTQSRSRTIHTDDSGHFIARVFLDFVPTHVRVLANENISATNPIEIIEPTGVSLISDVDDTIKRSNIGMGAREIFRNTFIRDLGDLTVPGVPEWYHTMHDLGVELHYCSNSPWQLFPVLATFFHMAGLPQGSIHLKHYSGMLQGIFEPVAERKKGTLEAILKDFPERRFILVGDSGEADLEVYTELAVQNPGRVLGIFIRDVTTRDELGFFDSGFTLSEDQRSTQRDTGTRTEKQAVGNNEERRPQLPPRTSASSAGSAGPVEGTLIDLSDESTQISPSQSRRESHQSRPRTATTSSELPLRKAPPPRPAKPAALRSASSSDAAASPRDSPLSAPNPRVHALSVSGGSPQPHLGSTSSSPAASHDRITPPPPPPPRRSGTASSMQGVPQPQPQQPIRRANTNFDGIVPASASSSQGSLTPPNVPPNNATAAALSKKVDLWLRRLSRAHETLDEMGVPLYTWRRGEDVIKEAEGIVKEALKDGAER
ncbi:hypothetical protein B0T21DRAFT_287892, partial [Apiosordaria backusii]